LFAAGDPRRSRINTANKEKLKNNNSHARNQIAHVIAIINGSEIGSALLQIDEVHLASRFCLNRALSPRRANAPAP
jgi:hypothetical protein